LALILAARARRAGNCPATSHVRRQTMNFGRYVICDLTSVYCRRPANHGSSIGCRSHFAGSVLCRCGTARPASRVRTRVALRPGCAAVSPRSFRPGAKPIAEGSGSVYALLLRQTRLQSIGGIVPAEGKEALSLSAILRACYARVTAEPDRPQRPFGRPTNSQPTWQLGRPAMR